MNTREQTPANVLAYPRLRAIQAVKEAMSLAKQVSNHRYTSQSGRMTLGER